MGGHEILEKLRPLLDAEYLEPDQNYHWSEWTRPASLDTEDIFILLGTYEDWFKWFMAHQRFRAFHIVVIIEPVWLPRRTTSTEGTTTVSYAARQQGFPSKS